MAIRGQRFGELVKALVAEEAAAAGTGLAPVSKPAAPVARAAVASPVARKKKGKKRSAALLARRKRQAALFAQGDGADHGGSPAGGQPAGTGVGAEASVSRGLGF